MSYIIGIDLGTTNCTMACMPAGEEVSAIEQVSISQLVGPGTQGEHPLFPSFAYLPLKEELKSKLTALEWDPKRKYCLGQYARDRGSEVSDRLVSSAKSWLCHAGIDRRAKVLPAASNDEELEKMSPVDTCALLLQHLKEAWNFKQPEHDFTQQKVLVTVPASFDPSALQLVHEAAQIAGYPDIVLLEEPQAAFYAWLHKHHDEWRKLLNVGDVILVVDSGGGTTDFSLIAVDVAGGDLVLNRIAVGSHLLLGGDNIDLALAYHASDKLAADGHEVDEWQMESLRHACRQAKETLLSNDGPDAFDVTIMGRGSSLIGNSITTTLTKKEVQEIVLDSFFPLLAAHERSSTERRSGMQQVGLPYAQDARITCQLAKFLSMTGESDSVTMEHFVMPTAVLFNGGTMKSDALQERVLDALNAWAGTLQKPQVRLLPGSDYDYAVSRGAAYYGFTRQGKGIRIKGGASRSYFIGVEDAVPAVPGRETPLSALCVVPHGMEEGTEQQLESKEFALVLGENAQFRFFSRAAPALSDGTKPEMGTALRRWKSELTELDPVEAFLNKEESDGKTIRVKLRSHITELGVLELWCETEDERRWKLEFNVRHQD